jgi:hypothetical protein
MSDYTERLKEALLRAADYDAHAAAALDQAVRTQCEARARFYHDLAEALRQLIAEQSPVTGA